MKMSFLRAPFPYFGGKSTVADTVWSRLGDVVNYVEPFFGSGAVLLARPHPSGIETVNDADAYLSNFWRAVQAKPEEVADGMNWPVNEVDLEARHKWLVQSDRKREHVERMKCDPDYYDAKIAAWWCWGLAQWIGRGWCEGEWYGHGDERNHGRGTCNNAAKLPHLGGGGKGVHRKRPHLGNAGMGVHCQLPHLGNAGKGECERRGEALREWMGGLADRLRGVRVCCGDWSRIMGPSVTEKNGVTGIFLDPPYGEDAGRDNALYTVESGTVAREVREWCMENGSRAGLRIVLAGYEGEHDELERLGWSKRIWRAHGGYGLQQHREGGAEYKNRYQERLWISPHCVGQMALDKTEVMG